MSKAGEKFEKLVAILATLRGEGGCPWDREQTYADINPYLLEEAHEVAESVDQKDFDGLKEELGDLLVHILFYSQMAKEDEKFAVGDVVASAAEKLIRRHPHVFGETKVANTEEVLVNWEKIKQEERRGKEKKSMLEGLPKALPALVKAFRIGEKTHRVGFDWPDTEGVLKKLKEELAELEEALGKGDNDGGKERTEAEFGDLLFTLANLGRFLKLDPETALRKAAHRFIQRFQWMEEKIGREGKALQDLSAAEWDQFWGEAKSEIASSNGVPNPS